MIWSGNKTAFELLTYFLPLFVAVPPFFLHLSDVISCCIKLVIEFHLITSHLCKFFAVLISLCFDKSVQSFACFALVFEKVLLLKFN